MRQLIINMPNLYSSCEQPVTLKRPPLRAQEAAALIVDIEKRLAQIGAINVPGVNEYGHITGARQTRASTFGVARIINAWAHLETMRLANHSQVWTHCPRDSEGLLILNSYNYRLTIERAEPHVWKKLLAWVRAFLQDQHPASFLEDMLISSAHAGMVMSRLTRRGSAARKA